MSTEIQGAAELCRLLTKEMVPAVLEALGPVVRVEADRVGAAAQITVPRRSGDLASTHFVDGPQTSGETVTATTGYESPHAGAVHEGFHGGRRKVVPPKWLEHSAAGRESELAQAAGRAIWDALKGFAR